MNEYKKTFIMVVVFAILAGTFACVNLEPMAVVFATLASAGMLLGPFIFEKP